MTGLGIGRFPGVITRQRLTALSRTATVLGAGLATASPASAGGVGDFLSPAFGTLCGNLNNGAHANGTATSATGAAGGNLAGIPIGSPLNHCGGADASPTATAGFSLLKLADIPVATNAPDVIEAD
ncbi:chaplin family protein [Streptomyces sp. NPDC049837]|uniref:chaplin family protein n=1 Tax=Streptomyces sp. NPDC049837 TaxID=3155277 RepID=UPI00342A796E